MTLEELHQKILLAPTPLYDEHLSNVMNEQAYLHYAFRNPGHTYYVYLAKLVRELQPRKVVELGTDLGRSALFMMTELPSHSELWTVELGDQKAVDLDIYEGDGRLHIVKGNSSNLDTLLKVGPGVDLLFVDADHTYESVVRDWMTWRRMMAPDGIAVFDDIHLNPGMERFWGELDVPKLDTGLGLHFSGFGLVQPRV